MMPAKVFPLHPLPRALRLSCRRAFGKAPRPPFGLEAWSESDDAGICILLDLPASWPSSGFGDPEVVLEQVPDPRSLAPGQIVVVLGRGAPRPEWLGRLLAKRTWVSPATRATALLSGRYQRIGAGLDPQTRSDIVWGYG
jgi:hypothetical protein